MVKNPSNPPRFRLGIDIGGTFTDLVLHDAETSNLAVAKTLSTPSDPSIGALEGTDLILAQRGISLGDIDQIVHATTHGANIIIEGVGARTALLITEGFGDILLIQRQLRYSPYDILLERHPPLVPRDLVFEVPERILFDGRVDVPLDEATVRSIAAQLRQQDVEAVAVSLLHSYANPRHEQRIGEILAGEVPEIIVSLSSMVAPVAREYERTSTTVANAYIRPAFQQYLGNLERTLAERGFQGSLFMMQANAGIADLESSKEVPVRVLESGPAGAIEMAQALAANIEPSDVLAFDMGGTTAKAGLITGGRAGVVDAFEVDKTLLREGTGLPVLIPSVDIIEVGAGGGSVARATLGIIEVGPQSAGADPGPASYGRGGTAPTVTDANLILGYINPDFFNGGAMSLDVDAARAAIVEHLVEPLGMSIAECAWGVHAAVTENMEHALRAVSTDRGSDPRTITLLACGGAAPLHASGIARKLGMTRVVVPVYAGVFSSIGLLHAEPRFDLVASYPTIATEASPREMDERFRSLETVALQRLATTGLERGQALERSLDMRYRGQGHILTVPLTSLTGGAALERVRVAFCNLYASLYGAGDQEAEVEVTALRLTARAASPHLEIPRASRDGSARNECSAREAYFAELGDYVSTTVHRRAELHAGTSFAGPAIIEDAESTVIALPGDQVYVDPNLNLLIDCDDREVEEHV